MRKVSAGGIIVNEKNEIVMVTTDARNWQFPKGNVEKGEEYLTTALREIEEETKLKGLKLIKKLPMYTRPSLDEKKRRCLRDIHYFLFQTKKREVQASAEVIGCEWVPIDKVLDRMVYPTDKEFFRKVKKSVQLVLDQKQLAIWAADCAEHVLPYFEKEFPKDKRPWKAIKACRSWVRTGIFRMADIRNASLSAHAAAKRAKENSPARFAAHAAGQAVATAHVPEHAYGPSYYALKIAATIGPANVVKEYNWQLRRLPKHLREGWLDWQKRRLPKKLSKFLGKRL